MPRENDDGDDEKEKARPKTRGMHTSYATTITTGTTKKNKKKKRKIGSA
jgi:hypothetical protein